MTDPATVRKRYFLVVLSRLVPAFGAALGILLVGRAVVLEQRVLGVAIVLSALFVMATLPRALAHRWRTPPER